MPPKQLELNFPAPLSHLQLLRKSVSRLGRYEYIFFFGLVLPNFITTIWLKWQRVQRFGELNTGLQLIDVFKSDLMIYLGFSFMGLALLGYLSKRKHKVWFIMLLQVVTCLAVMIEIASHNYYMITGSAFDYGLLSYTIQKFDELQGVVASESTSSSLAVLRGSVVANLVLPWLLLLVYQVISEKPKAAPALTGIRANTIRHYFLGLAMLCYLLLLLPVLQTGQKMFVQNSLVNVVSTFFERWSGEGDLHEPSWQPPVDTSLVLRRYAKKRNLVIIVLESTRARSTSAYNSELDTTPFLKGLARKSMVARMAFSIIPRTSKSLVPIHCGIEPRPSITIKENQQNGIASRCLPELLNEQGYDTVYFQTAWQYFERRKYMVRNLGHSEFFPGDSHSKKGFSNTNYFGYEDRILVKPSEKWHLKRIRQGKKNPFMVTYLTNTTHHGYDIPKGFKTKRYVREPSLNRYLNTIRYTDGVVAEIFAQYKKLGIYRNTIFVIVGDHGEGFWEHDLKGHSNTVYSEGLHIPLLIHDPQRFRRGLEVKRPVAQHDILPTVAGLMGFKIEGTPYRGRNMLERHTDYTLHHACWHERLCAGSLTSNELIKYIHYFGKDDDEAYDLKVDPEEKVNIIDQLPAGKIAGRKKELLAWYNNLELFYRNYQESPQRVQ